jgi:hypothetical protein
MATNLRHLVSILTCAAILLCLSIASYAQNREKFVISAKAGGINAVTGRAKVHLKGGADWQQLSVTDDLEAGDVVRTELGGRVEMLLNPGSYLRLGENSEFELVNSSLDNLEFRLVRGTAIVEATGADDTELMINITTPHTKMAIVRHGLYRLNVVPENATELIVRKGRVMLNDDSHTKVKGGNKVIISANSQAMVAKLTGDEKKAKDDIAEWSKERAEALAKANRRISDRMLASAFNSFRSSDWLFNSYRSAGFWFFDSRSRCYTFLPFYYGWGSPYGGSYSIAVYNPFYWNRGGYSNGVTYNPRTYPSGGGVQPPRGDISSPGPAPTRQPDQGMSAPGPRPTRDMGSSPSRGIAKPMDMRPDVMPRQRPNQD